jgi:hypothetical protein
MMTGTGCVAYHAAEIPVVSNAMPNVLGLGAMDPDPAAVEPLLYIMRAGDPAVRYHAARVVSRHAAAGDAGTRDRAVAALIERLSDHQTGQHLWHHGFAPMMAGVPPVREAAHDSLCALTGQDFGYDLPAWRYWRLEGR